MLFWLISTNRQPVGIHVPHGCCPMNLSNYQPRAISKSCLDGLERERAEGGGEEQSCLYLYCSWTVVHHLHETPTELWSPPWPLTQRFHFISLQYRNRLQSTAIVCSKTTGLSTRTLSSIYEQQTLLATRIMQDPSHALPPCFWVAPLMAPPSLLWLQDTEEKSNLCSQGPTTTPPSYPQYRARARPTRTGEAVISILPPPP